MNELLNSPVLKELLITLKIFMDNVGIHELGIRCHDGSKLVVRIER